MTWKDITVEQYQGCAKILSDKEMSDPEKNINLVCLLLDMTEKQVKDLSLNEWRKKLKAISFLHDGEIPGKPEKYIKSNGKTYFVNYRVEKHRFGQYVEEITFAPNYIENTHLLIASIVQPVKVFAGFKRLGKNDSSNHEEIANDILKARFIDVYHTAVFFYQLLKNLMMDMEGYLVGQMISKGMKKEEAQALMTASIHAMDGCLTQKELQTTTI